MTELLSTLVFGGLAVFLAFRLYSVLGKHEGHMEGSIPVDNTGNEVAQGSGRNHLRAAYEGPAAAGLEAIAAVDSSFNPDGFLEGARSAYSMIVQGFAEGNRDLLRNLLASKVFDRYSAAIDEREQRGESVKTEIERISSADITDAVQNENVARVTVCFNAEIATETLDKNGKHVSGDLGYLTKVRENWIFERHTDSSDPNWVLSGVATA